MDSHEIEVLDEVASTNDAARERAAAGAGHGYAVRACRQTAGRGQRGHGWISPEGGLYLSIVLRSGVPQHLMSGLSAACGIGAARALEALGAQGVRIKWPNDLVVGSAKLGGILVEAGWAAGGVYAVCGIGVNLEVPALEDAPRGALPPASLAQAMPEGAALPGVDALAEALRSGIVDAVDGWARDIAAAGAAAMPLGRLGSELYDRMAFMGEYIALVDREGAPYGAGTLTGIDMWGHALVRMDDGTGREVAFDPAQVSLRPFE